MLDGMKVELGDGGDGPVYRIISAYGLQGTTTRS